MLTQDAHKTNGVGMEEEGLELVDFYRETRTCRYCRQTESVEVNIYRFRDMPTHSVTIIDHECEVIGRGKSLDVRRWRVIMDALSDFVNRLTKDL